MKRKHSFWYKTGTFLGFAGPAVFCFIMVLMVPFVYGLYLTFTGWNGISADKAFVGFGNYITTFQDADFWRSVLLTLIYSAISVILINVLAFVLAYLVTSGIKGQNFFRAGFFTPNLVGGLILGYIWQFIFSRALVSVGTKLQIGIFSTSWLSDPDKALFALIIVTVWQYSGFMMLIYIAGLMSVPKDLLEAARIDGCRQWQCTRFVTLPLMVSSFVVCLFLSITRCFMAYDLNLSLTDGGPFNSTVMAAMHVYMKAFTTKDYGVGQTEAAILFVICVVISISQVMIGKKKEVSM